MARQKNDGRGRLGGRAKGTPNRQTNALREWVICLLNDNREQVEKDLKTLTPKERVQSLFKLLDFCLPKLQSVSTRINFDDMSDADIDNFIARMIESESNYDNDNIDF